MNFPSVPLEKDVCEYHIYSQEPSAYRAQEILQTSSNIIRLWNKDYIWQDQSFKLQVNADHSLAGTTSFGDCIEDEWFIVWTLHELSKQCEDIFAKITDTDGEFLLIESARHLPRWLDPDTASNRCWIRCGQLVIIEPSPEDIKKKQCPELSLDAALRYLRAGHKTLQNDKIQHDAFFRIQHYPEQSRTERHRVKCRLPRTIAALLHTHSHTIAPICRAFYARDPLQSKSFANKRPSFLTTEQVEDQVEATVQFTRTLYALIKGARFVVPKWYPGCKAEHAMTGSKLVCGACLLYDSKDNQTVSQWLMERAAAKLPTDQEISQWSNEVDPDTYLEVDFTEIERAMAPDSRTQSYKKSTGDTDGTETVKRMVEQIGRFMDGESNLEGAEFSDDDEDDDEDEDDEDEYDEVNGDENLGDEEFMKFLRIPMMEDSLLDFLRQPGRPAASDRDSSDDDEEEEEGEIGNLKDYMAELDRELLDQHGVSTMPFSSNEHATTTTKPAKSEEFNKKDSDGMDDDQKIDFNVARNLLDSLKVEGGMSGPSAALLQRLGLFIPRDDEDEQTTEDAQYDDDVEPLD